LNKLHQKYKDRIAFHVVYIQEAHSSDFWQMAVNERDGVVYAEPRSAEQRHNVAAACVRNLKIEFPAVVDGIDNATEIAYTAWPDRLYLIGADGRVAWKSRPGPFGFNTAVLEKAIERLPAQQTRLP